MPDYPLASKCLLCGNDDPLKIQRYIYPKTDEFLGIFCQTCQTEWFVENVVDSSYMKDDREYNIGGETLKQYDLPKQKCDCNSPINARTPVEDLSQLKEGDHFAFHRTYAIWHQGIINQVDTANNRFEAIHWSKGKDERIKVMKAWVDVDNENGELYKVEYDKLVKAVNSVKLVIARAFSMIGVIGYNLFKRNCEHFARFCKTGISESVQSQWAALQLRRVVKTVLSREAKWFQISFLRNRAASYLTAEGVERLLKRTNIVGAVIVIVIEGIFMVIDLQKTYSQRQRNQISYTEFIKESVTRLSEAVFSAGFTVAGGIGGEMVGAAIGTMICPGLGTLCGAIIGGVLCGAFASVVGTAAGNIIGNYIGGFIVKHIMYDDRAVDAITDLKKGDHIVFYSHLFHPRCHAIVYKLNGTKIQVIRNTYKKGVVIDILNFVKPIYKVMYTDSKCATIGKTLQRAWSQKGKTDYNLLTYNCKHFARWCKEK